MSKGTKTVLKTKRRRAFLAHAVIWIVAIAAGTAFAKFAYPELIPPGQLKLNEQNLPEVVQEGRILKTDVVKVYKDAWAEALRRVGAHEPPKVEDFVAVGKWGQQSWLHIKLGQIYRENIRKFDEEAGPHLDKLEKEFRGEWQLFFDRFEDTPSVEDYCKRIHEFHREKLKARLTEIDEGLKRKRPRTRLALDSFSGYCVLRSEKFREKAAARDLKLHLMDDGANYKKRIEALEQGDVEMAVFTLDALINNSALFDAPPAAVVLVLDETRGADAMIAYTAAFPDIPAMNRPDTEIILTPDSPSEFLARMVREKNKLPKLLGECFILARDVEDVFKRFQEADPAEPKAFVLWEPYISKALKEPKAPVKVLAHSGQYPGSIVDVLVARKDFLKSNKKDVEEIVRTYLEAVADYQKSPVEMTQLVQKDSERLAAVHKLPAALSPEEAEKVVKGIWWKNLEDNYSHFGLVPDPDGKHVPLDRMINDIGDVLRKAKVINKSVNTELLFHKDTCAVLKAENFDPAVAVTPMPITGDDVRSRLRPVASEKVEPVAFGTGSTAVSKLDEPVLQGLADKLAAEPRYYVEVRSHSFNDEEVNLELAKLRGEAVVNWLLSHGVAKEHIKVKVVKHEPGTTKGLVSFVILEEPK